MAESFYIKDTKEHFQFIPAEYRDDVKIGLSFAVGIACLTLFMLLALSN